MTNTVFATQAPSIPEELTFPWGDKASSSNGLGGIEPIPKGKSVTCPEPTRRSPIA